MPKLAATVPTPSNPTADRGGNAPAFVARHRALKAAVWRNVAEHGPFFTVTISRSYKVEDDWKESSSFGFDDVLIVAELLRSSHSFIAGQMAREGDAKASV